MIDVKFDGLLFDLDGTLIDSREVISRAWSAFAKKYQLSADKVVPAIHGKPASESISMLRPDASKKDIELDSEWLETMESNDTQGVVALPGAIELINTLNNHSIPWAIVTSGTLPVATARIRAADLPFPELLVTPEQVERGKPYPEPFLLAASKLGVDINNCIVFEDAPAGIESSCRAGATTIGVLTQFSEAQLMEKKADVCIATLQDIQISMVGSQQLLSIKKSTLICGAGKS